MQHTVSKAAIRNAQSVMMESRVHVFHACDYSLNYDSAVLFQLLFSVLVSVKVLDHKFLQLLLSFSNVISVSVSVTILIFQFSVSGLVLYRI